MIRPEREPTSYDLALNKAAITFKKEQIRKEILPKNFPTLNRILDRTHDYDIPNRVRTPLIHQQRPYQHIDDTVTESERIMGPGYYDVTKFDHYIHDNLHNFKFGLSKTKRGSFIPTVTNESREELPSVKNRPHTAEGTTKHRRQKSKSRYFGTQPRWSGGIYRKDDCAAGAGMGLGPDFDKAFIRKSYGTFSKVPRQDERPRDAPSNPLDVDAGNKISIATAVKVTDKRYWSAFR